MPEIECPECGGSGLRYRVRTPNLDYRDPAFVADEYVCERCGGDGIIEAPEPAQ